MEMVKPMNNKAIYQGEDENSQDTYFTVLFSINCVLLVLGILANLVVLLVLYKPKHQNKGFCTFLVMHLSMVDLVLRAIGLYALIIGATKSMPLFHCKSLIFLLYSCCASVFALLSGIAVDRFLHIIHPLKSLQFKPRRSFVIGCIWAYSAVVSMPFIFSAEPRYLKPHRFWNQHHLNSTEQAAPENFSYDSFDSLLKLSNHSRTNLDVDPGHNTCVALVVGEPQGQIAITVYFVLVFVAPLLIMAYSYGRIFLFLSKKAAVTRISAPIARSKLKAVRMLIVVVFSFVCSWGPLLVFDLLHAYTVISDFMRYLPARPLLESFCYTSSIMNLVIYAFNDSSFRKTTTNIIRKWNVFPNKQQCNNYRVRKL